MALMERVATLLRANINDLIDRAEDPDKMLKQLERDFENQLLQLKTQLAVAITDKHMLMTRLKGEVDAEKDWRGRAELAVKNGKDDMARGALERALDHEQRVNDLTAQLAEQSDEVEGMRTMYNQLEGKLKHARHHMVLLTSQMRRAQVSGRAITAQQAAQEVAATIRSGPALERVKARIAQMEGTNYANRQLADGEGLEDQFAEMERGEQVERLLAELKGKDNRMLEAG